MRIGLFGGCFNPPHKMHHKIARELIDKKYVDKVIFIPTGNGYEKEGLIQDIDRYNMLQEMTQGKNDIEVSNYELGKPKYTYETLRHFQKQNPNDQIYFICGTDNLKELDTWKEYLEILKNYKLLVISRNQDQISKLKRKYEKYKQNIIETDIEVKRLSSTLIREKIKEGESLEKLQELLDKPVLQYIRTHELYRK